MHPRTDPRFGLSCQRAQYVIAARKGRAAGCKSTARTCKTGRKAPAHTPKTRLFSPLPPRLKTCGTPGFGCQHTKQPTNSATVLGFWPPFSPVPNHPQNPSFSTRPYAACFALPVCLALSGSLLKQLVRSCRNPDGKAKQQTPMCITETRTKLREFCQWTAPAAVARWLHLQWHKPVAAAGDGSRWRAAC